MNRRLIPSDVKVQYTIEPVVSYLLKRTTQNDHASVIEDVARVGTIDDARQLAKAITEHERLHPEDVTIRVIDFGDTEIH